MHIWPRILIKVVEGYKLWPEGTWKNIEIVIESQNLFGIRIMRTGTLTKFFLLSIHYYFTEITISLCGTQNIVFFFVNRMYSVNLVWNICRSCWNSSLCFLSKKTIQVKRKFIQIQWRLRWWVELKQFSKWANFVCNSQILFYKFLTIYVQLFFHIFFICYSFLSLMEISLEFTR